MVKRKGAQILQQAEKSAKVTGVGRGHLEGVINGGALKTGNKYVGGHMSAAGQLVN